MPSCGSQTVLCELPVRFDTYKGCSHNCSYCFVRRKAELRDPKPSEGTKALKSFIDGKRAQDTVWCDWEIPLHWGGMSDPFQPCELEYKNSWECLKIFADTQYPVVFSTKGYVAGMPEYLDMFKRCNVVSQVSMVSPHFDKLEPGAPTFQERLEMLPGLAKNTKRLIVRLSPYTLGLADDVCSHLQAFKDAGVYGIEIEAMKRANKKPGMVKVAGDWCYPIDALRKEFSQIRHEAKSIGLTFYSGENRLRGMGDDTCCCGVVGVPGFKPNRANLNRLVVGEEIEYTDGMRKENSAVAFKGMFQSTAGSRYLRKQSYSDVMDLVAKTKTYLYAMGLIDEK